MQNLYQGVVQQKFFRDICNLISYHCWRRHKITPGVNRTRNSVQFIRRKKHIVGAKSPDQAAARDLDWEALMADLGPKQCAVVNGVARGDERLHDN
jgi:hypothetical protein